MLITIQRLKGEYKREFAWTLLLNRKDRGERTSPLRIYNCPIVKFDLQKHHRRSIRLENYDYSQAGAYFVTIVAWHRDSLFGEVCQREMILNNHGKIADECWRLIPDHFPQVELGAYVIMPNHVHGIIIITDQRRGAALLRPYTCPDDNHIAHKINVQPGSLGAIVRSYKSAVSYRINKEFNAAAIWQRNYYEHIIRDENELQNKTDYIEANPLLWEQDEENPITPLLPPPNSKYLF